MFCFSLVQLIRKPTRSTKPIFSIFNLVQTSMPDNASSIPHLPAWATTVCYRLTSTYHAQNLIRRKQFRFTKEAILELLTGTIQFSRHLPRHLPQLCTNQLEHIFDKINELTGKYMPSRTMLPNNNAAWYSTHLKRLSNRKQRLHKLAKLSPSTVQWADCKEASKGCVNALKTAKEFFWLIDQLIALNRLINVLIDCHQC